MKNPVSCQLIRHIQIDQTHRPFLYVRLDIVWHFAIVHLEQCTNNRPYHFVCKVVYPLQPGPNRGRNQFDGQMVIVDSLQCELDSTLLLDSRPLENRNRLWSFLVQLNHFLHRSGDWDINFYVILVIFVSCVFYVTYVILELLRNFSCKSDLTLVFIPDLEKSRFTGQNRKLTG